MGDILSLFLTHRGPLKGDAPPRILSHNHCHDSLIMHPMCIRVGATNWPKLKPLLLLRQDLLFSVTGTFHSVVTKLLPKAATHFESSALLRTVPYPRKGIMFVNVMTKHIKPWDHDHPCLQDRR